MSYRDHLEKIFSSFCFALVWLYGVFMGTVFGSIVVLVILRDASPVVDIAYLSAMLAVLGSSTLAFGPGLKRLAPDSDVELLPWYYVKAGKFWTVERYYAWFGAVFAGLFGAFLGSVFAYSVESFIVLPICAIFAAAVGAVSALAHVRVRLVLAALAGIKS